MRVYKPVAVIFVWSILASVVAAAPPLKALIVDGQMNKWHGGTALTPPLKALLEETKLFHVDVATSPAKGEGMSGFKPEFEAYDVVVMNYDGEHWPADTKASFVKYVRDGGGLVIYHSADNAFVDWPEYNEMIAVGGWGGRSPTSGVYVRWRDGKMVLDPTPGQAGSHGPQHAFQLVVRAPEHPVTKGLPERFMHAPDELYDRMRGPAKNLTVLATAYSSPNQRGTGEHEPMLMAIRFGKGRVFHTTLGHAAKQLKSVAFIATYQRGAEWAATGKVTQPIPTDFPGPDEPSVRR
jgi:type 1 glutamine amidotransferase